MVSSAIVTEVGVKPEASCSCAIDTGAGIGCEPIFPLKGPINQCCWLLDFPSVRRRLP